EDLLLIVGHALRLPMSDERVQLAVADECALETAWLAFVDGQVEHVAATEELLRTHLVENDPRIDPARHRERDAAWDVRLDQAGDDVGRRPLRGDDQMDADRARELGDTADEVFDLPRGPNHEFGEIIDHYHDVRTRSTA